MDCSPPGSSVHGIFQARTLEWVVMPFSRGSSRPRDWTQVSCIVGRRFTVWATRKVPNWLLGTFKRGARRRPWGGARCKGYLGGRRPRLWRAALNTIRATRGAHGRTEGCLLLHNFHSTDQGWDLRPGISHKLPGDMDAPDSGTAFGETRSWTVGNAKRQGIQVPAAALEKLTLVWTRSLEIHLGRSGPHSAGLDDRVSCGGLGGRPWWSAPLRQC